MRSLPILGFCAVLLPASAQADVTYDFIVNTIAPSPTAPLLSANPFPTNFMTLTDPVVQSGAFSANFGQYGLGWPGAVLNGRVGVQGRIPITTADQDYHINLSFDGDLLSGLFDVSEPQDELRVAGSGLDWSGWIGSDLLTSNPAGCDGTCYVRGYWKDPNSVPEPSALLLLLTGFGFLLMWRIKS